AGWTYVLYPCISEHTHQRHRHSFPTRRSSDLPNRVTVVVSGLRDTHKSWWECDTGIAFLVSGLPDWRTRRMTQIYDLSDPSEPADRKSTRLNSSHVSISYAVFCLKKKTQNRYV